MAKKSQVAMPISHPATWIFRGDPREFDLIGYLNADLPRISWTLRQHQHDVEIGDEVYIWQSRGKRRRPSGIIGRARIASAPFKGIDRDALPYWRVGLGLRADETRVWLTVEDAVESITSHRVVSRESLLTDTECRALRVLTGRGTNSFVHPHEAERLRMLW
ncbi:MAG: hypothetical protein R3F65_08340 [bacterium]|nr:hypothetical protein [Myxococcales bacterium]